MRRLANLLLLTATVLAVLGARLRVAWLGQPDVPQWAPVVSNAAGAAIVAGFVLAVLAACCRRPGGSGGVLVAGGAVQVLIAGFASSPAAAETWRWTAPWVVALAGAVWLPGAFSIARTAELSFRRWAAFACSFRVAAFTAFLLLSLVASQLGSPRSTTWAVSPPDQVQRLGPSEGMTTSMPFVTVEALATAAATPPHPVTLTFEREVLAPFGGLIVPDGRFHRINFKAPAGPFTIATAPTIEVGKAYAFSGRVRLAGKLIGFCQGLLWAAAIIGVAGAATFRRSASWGRWFGWDESETRLLPLLLLLPYLAVAGNHLDTFAGGSDSSGYLNSARLIRHGHLLAPLRQAAPAPDGTRLAQSLSVPNGFILHSGPALAPTYPPGLPLLIAASNFVLPERAAIAAVILAHLFGGILLLYGCGIRLGLSSGMAAAAAGVLALCPVYIFMGLQTMSDVPSLVWVLLAVSLALSPTRPLLCGLATAIAVLIRPSNALALPVVLIALCSSREFTVRKLFAWGAAGLPFAAAEGYYNHRLYGHAFASGYGNPAALFQLEYLAPTLRHYATWFPRLLTPFVPLALGFPFLKKLPSSTRWLLAAWIFPLVVFYAFYSCTHETWWYLRFLLPAFPGVLLAAALTLEHLFGVLPRRAGPLFGFPVAVVAVVSLLAMDAHLDVLDSGKGNRVYRTAAAWLVEHTPPNVLVVNGITAGALTYYTHLDFAIPTTRSEARAIESFAQAARRPLYAVYFRFDATPLTWFTGGHWLPAANSGDLVLFRFAGP